MLARLKWNPSWRRRVPVIHQATATECSSACLAMIASYWGWRIELNDVRTVAASSARGVTVRDMLDISDRLGMRGHSGKANDLRDLKNISLPAVLHFTRGHFVVLVKANKSGVVLHDPAHGIKRLSWDELSEVASGIFVEFVPNSKFSAEVNAPRLRLKNLLRHIQGFGFTIAKVFVLSALLQGSLAIAPLYMQLIIDNSIAKSDTSVLMFLFIVFLTLQVIAAAIHFVRRMVLLRAGQILTLGMMSDLFRHMLMLPSKFYELRDMGDIVSRFSSTNAIQGFLTGTVIDALVDGVSALFILAVLYLYSGQLALVSLSILCLQGIVYFGSFRLRNWASADALMASAREQTAFIESVRAVRSIKLFGKEVDRFNHWLGRLLEMAETHYRYLSIDSSVLALVSLIEAIGGVGIIFLAARWTIDGKFTLGMMISFVGYQAFFGRSAKNAVDAIVSFQSLSVHLDRIADLALARPEEIEVGQRPAFTGQFSLQDLNFSYPNDRKPCLKNISVSVDAGEVIAITGPSGEGKSTLLKVLLGLETPSSGMILYNGVEFGQISRSFFLGQIGAVLQEDALLSGSIADNITFFAPHYDINDVHRCAKWAAIHEDVIGMTMQYNTEVGEMGSALSGGQRQRVLLARALYKNPKILLMDEATSHLDLATESRINDTLRSLKVTQIIVAHRPDSLRIANRVFRLSGGALVQVFGNNMPVAMHE